MSLVLPRIMQRLLYTLTQDRKTSYVTTLLHVMTRPLICPRSLDNWQTTLRKQYFKRDPDANPIGFEPVRPSRDASVVPTDKSRASTVDVERRGGKARSQSKQEDVPGDDVEMKDAEAEGSGAKDEAEDAEGDKADVENEKMEVDGENAQEEQEENPEDLSKDWRELDMLTKLESMHTVQEWLFWGTQPRIRQIMRSDDEHASWVSPNACRILAFEAHPLVVQRIEPIGYDSKTNAYWLIGGDRLWIQRVPPKPSKKAKRKRPQKGKEAATPRPSKKRKADPEVAVASPSKKKGSSSKSKGSSSKKAAPAPEEPKTPTGRSVRAAKVNANLKLDAQAKQMAEFQRQSAAEAKRPTKPFPSRPLGTRISSRLRHSTTAEEVEDPEWQPVPKEWLEDEESSKPATRKRKTGLEEEEDEISELTDLSEEEDEPAPEPPKVEEHEEEEHQPEAENATDEAAPKDFLEWETVE